MTLDGLQPWVRSAADYAIAIANHYGIRPQVTSGYRSWTVQKRLRDKFEECVAQGRYPSGPDCKWPANRPGDSAHNFGLAFDSWVPDAQWPAWNYIRWWVGFRVPANDRIHAEVPNWRSYVGRA